MTLVATAAKASSAGSTQLDYVQITAGVTIAATADGNGGATAVIDGNAITLDGATRIMIEFGFNVLVGVGNEVVVNLYDGTTDLGRVSFASDSSGTVTADVNLYGARFLTPSAGSHTYHIRAWKTSGASVCSVYAGAGGASTNMPAWYRITTA